MYVVKIAHAVIEHIPHKSRNVCHGIYTSRAIKITVSGIDTMFTEKKCYFLMPVCLNWLKGFVIFVECSFSYN